ncbi:ABC transporter ATP-binding protein [Brevundimonas nasdae]|uniref:ABC transporter ATP-binding protein/permease n=1 Tax=Brevundimonas nasdae TaxID=172043 RepID=A0ABX8TEB1_9CAUL|nr:ABC transporter ATP-binding protein [Brevundimonas nasdae]QYC08898.1 ABC transporter ATP-binding protein/permease [Brevundimonas nasdae]QYC14947.1 ABC transporter ATP-binding protein/permease [Brevundimonas nasdae]
MTTTAAETMPLRALLARIWRDYLSRHKGSLVLSILLAAVTGLLTAALLKLLEPAVNGLFLGGTAPISLFGLVEFPASKAILWIPAAILAVAVARTLAAIGQAALVNRLGHTIVGDIQVRLFGAMIRADLARLRSQHSGGFVSSVLFDANLVREAFTSGVVTYTQNLLTLIAVLIYMGFIDWQLTMVVLLGVPMVALVLRRFGRKTRKAAVGAMTETENLSTALMENLDGVRLIKIENREAAEEARVGEVVARRQRHVIKGANARAFAGPSSDLVAYIVVAAVMAYAGWRAQSGEMTVGGFAAFIGMLLAAGQALRQVTNLATVMAEGFTAARRLFGALDIEPEIREAPDAAPLAAGPVEVVLDRVSFAYAPAADGGAPTLDQVSLRVAPGETVALVGPSGGGKSTILSLLPRFYDVTGGAVTLNGRDLRDLRLHDLREHIALVTQEPFLFDDTIANNIAYGRPGATQDQIEAAARSAAAHDFITALPQGYDTRAGEAGLRLSGGQRQRIAIARAFVKDAPILLLDEATSALDTESEALVQAALERLMQGRATLMIAHRLSTVKNANRIYVIEAGRVVEEGSHDALVAKGGLYARLARQQSLDGAPVNVETVA